MRKHCTPGRLKSLIKHKLTCYLPPVSAADHLRPGNYNYFTNSSRKINVYEIMITCFSVVYRSQCYGATGYLSLQKYPAVPTNISNSKQLHARERNDHAQADLEVRYNIRDV